MPIASPVEFLGQLQMRASARGTHLHDGKRIDGNSSSTWITAGAGRTGLFVSYVVWRDNRIGIELWISRDRDKRIFSSLQLHKSQIEAAFGEPLVWERQDGLTTARIKYFLTNVKFGNDMTNWPKCQDQLIDAIGHFRQALALHNGVTSASPI